MENIHNDSAKRLHLQGIRGIAIIVVVGFHFYPQFMPNGYLGVDQFFVLSGFLMCMLLKRADKESPCSLVSLFYSKRFKRILPLYLLVIFLSMLALYNYFPDTAIETNKESASHALLFVSNRPKTDQEDYFQKLNIAEDIFTHTWSLSVEIQFYLIVPFIFLLVRGFTESRQIIYLGMLTFISFALFLYFSPQESFNNISSRSWQFLLGIITYLTSIKASEFSSESCESSEKLLDSQSEDSLYQSNVKSTQSKCVAISKHLLLLVVLSILFIPLPLNSNFVRPLITILTSVLLLISEDNVLLSNLCITYFGDISYSLYLIHWPLYAHWKLTADGNQYYLVIYLIGSALLSCFIHETFEKWYLSLSFSSVALLVIFLYFCNVITINKDVIYDNLSNEHRNFSTLDLINDNMTIDDAQIYNYRWDLNDYQNLFVPTCDNEKEGTAFGWCRHKGLSKRGKYKMVLIGNSWAANHATLFYQECGQKSMSILQGAASACETLFPTVDKPNCKENFTDFEVRVRAEAPDFLFIFTRFISTGAPFPVNVSSFDEDPIYHTMKNQMEKFIQNVKFKIFILDYLPRINVEIIEKIVPLLKNKTKPSEIDALLINFEMFKMARKRHEKLMEDCGGKCVLVDYAPRFWNETSGTFRYFDERGFSYFTSTTHLSPHGLEHIRPVWTDICKRL